MRSFVLFFIPFLISVGNGAIAFEGYEISTSAVPCSEPNMTGSMYKSTIAPSSTSGFSSTSIDATISTTLDSTLSSSTIPCATATVSMTTTLTVTTFITISAGETTTTEEASTVSTNTDVPSKPISTTHGHTIQSSSSECGHESISSMYTSQDFVPSQSSLSTGTPNTTFTSNCTIGTDTINTNSAMTAVTSVEASSNTSIFTSSKTVVSAGTTSPAASAPVSQFSSAANSASKFLSLSPLALFIVVLEVICWI